MAYIIPDDKYQEIVAQFTGSSDNTIQRTSELLFDELFPGDTPTNGVTIDAISDELSDRFMDDVQLCEVCDWWCEISDLDEHEGMSMVCTQCRGEE